MCIYDVENDCRTDSESPSSDLDFNVAEMEVASHSPPAHLEEIDYNTDECGLYHNSCVHRFKSFCIYAAPSDLSQPEDELPEEEWISNGDESNSFMHDIGEDSEPDDTTSVQDLPPQSLAIVRWLTIFLLSLQTAYRLSNRAVHYLFRFLATFFVVLARHTSEFNFAQSFPPTLSNKRFLQNLTICCLS